MGTEEVTEPEGQDSNEQTPETQEKLLTQADVNKIVADRLAREAKKYAGFDELKKFKADAEKHRLASLNEHEQAIEKARAEARQEVAAQYAERVAAAEVRGVLAQLVDDPSDVMEELNMARFVTSDGDVDTEAVERLKEKYTKLLGKKKSSPSPTGHGRSSSSPATSNADAFANVFGNLLG